MQHGIKAALVCAVLSAVTLRTASAHLEPKPGEHMEKCYGIAKAHKNDCRTASHSCAGQAMKSGDPGEWVKVPTGLCTRLSGGSLTPRALK